MVVILILCSIRPALGPRGPSFTMREKLISLAGSAEVIALAGLVLGGLVVGWFTPTEAGAVGAFGAIVVTSLRRRLAWKGLITAVVEALKTSGMIYCILIGAFIFNYFLAPTNIPYVIADFVAGLPLPPLGVLGMIILVYLFLGCFLDVAAMTVLTIPIFFPLVVSLGFNPVWFGIIFVRIAEMAMITPPIGMNVYVIAGVAPDVPMQTIFKGIMPFLLADLCHVALLVLVPALVLFLPGLM